jgi:WD40 repeat protein
VVMKKSSIVVASFEFSPVLVTSSTLFFVSVRTHTRVLTNGISLPILGRISLKEISPHSIWCISLFRVRFRVSASRSGQTPTPCIYASLTRSRSFHPSSVLTSVDHTGSRVLSGSYDYTVRMYDFQGMNSKLQPFRQFEPFEGHQVRSLSWSPMPDRFLCVTGSAQANVSCFWYNCTNQHQQLKTGGSIYLIPQMLYFYACAYV